MSFSVHVDTKSDRFKRELLSGGNILSEIYLVAEDEPFPSQPWLDFPVIVLGWWLEGYRKLRETGEPVSNTFMNGPFEFVTTPSDDRITIRFRQRTLAGDVESRNPTDISKREYEDALLSAAEALLNAVAERPSQEDGDVGVLASEVELLRASRDP